MPRPKTPWNLAGETPMHRTHFQAHSTSKMSTINSSRHCNGQWISIISHIPNFEVPWCTQWRNVDGEPLSSFQTHSSMFDNISHVFDLLFQLSRATVWVIGHGELLHTSNDLTRFGGPVWSRRFARKTTYLFPSKTCNLPAGEYVNLYLGK